MRVIDPSFEILPDQADALSQIATRARICYKSEDKAQEDETPFVKGIIKHGHNSCLEMAVVTIEILNTTEKERISLFKHRWLIVDRLQDTNCIVTGSIRAFREYFMAPYANENLKACLFRFMFDYNPDLFYDIQSPKLSARLPYRVMHSSVYLGGPYGTYGNDLAKRHIHVAVKFIVNRAVTHEIVRHRPVAFLQESQRYCRYSDDKFGNEVTFIRPTAFPNIMNTGDYAIWETAMKQAETNYLLLLQDNSPQAARTVLPNSCKTEIIVYCNLREWEHIFALRTSKAAEPSMREVMIPLHADFQELFPKSFDNLKRSVA